MVRGHCSCSVEFELVDDDRLLEAGRERRLLRRLERLIGVEEIVLSLTGRRVLVIFHQVLITTDDIAEELVELGYVLRPVKGRKLRPISELPFLH